MLRRFILHLTLIEGVGPATVNVILQRLGLTHTDLLTLQLNHELYSLSMADWQQRLKCSLRIAERLVLGLRDQQKLMQELALIERYQINWVTIVDADYPVLLKQITNPPAVLYWQGDGKILQQPALALVGSRQADQYAQRVVNDLVPSLVAANFVIVSGGAIGADTMGHRAALKAQGKTVAVLGSGLLEPYPRSNQRLFSEIVAQGGVVLSPFALRCQALVGNFPARNHIIAGLSWGTIVVQAAQKSGARITAECALSQGRDLFVVPGHYGDILSAGCHELVAEGAKLIHQVGDILAEYQGKYSHDQVYNTSFKANDACVATTISQEKTSSQGLTKTELHGKQLSFTPQVVTETATQAILRVCQRPMGTDELMAQFQLDLDKLQSLLFDLQLDGLLAQNFAGLWYTL